MRWHKCGTVLSLCGLTLSAFGQSISIPDGSNRFIFLVDRSRSMKRSRAKIHNIERAKTAITRALLRGKASTLKLPKFNVGTDTLVVGRFGFDFSHDSSNAYMRLRWAQLGEDYLEPSLSPTSHPTSASLRAALDPGTRLTSLNILAWTVPIALKAFPPPTDKSVQGTYVIIINDAQMNGGSIGLENEMLKPRLSEDVRTRLTQTVDSVNQHVKFVNAQGIPGAIGRQTFGVGEDMILVTVLKATPTELNPSTPAPKLENALRGLSLEWEKTTQWQLLARLSSSGLGEGVQATVAIDNHRGSWKSPQGERLETEIRGLDPKSDGRQTSGALCVLSEHVNPILGRQQIVLSYPDSIWLPPSPLSGKRQMVSHLLLWAAGLLAIAAATWAAWHRWMARHFTLILPGFGREIQLHALSQSANDRARLRLPRRQGEIAFAIAAPPKWLRNIFYSDATVEWSANVQLEGQPSHRSMLVRDLPALSVFKWVERPTGAERMEFIVQRSAKLGAGGRIHLTIDHVALRSLDSFSVSLARSL